MCVITSRCSQLAAAEADTIKKQQLKQMQSGAIAEADAIREPWLKWTLSGSNGCSRCNGEQ